MAYEVRPSNYTRIAHDAEPCNCLALWQDHDGSYWCCGKEPLPVLSPPQTEVPDFVQRMKVELEQLNGRISSLGIFLETDQYRALDPFEMLLLQEQYYAMTTYGRLLNTRFILHETKAKDLKKAEPANG